MSIYDYHTSQVIESKDYPFYALIMAAMHGADTNNLAKLRHAWPEVWLELNDRYHSPGGLRHGETNDDV